MSTPLYSNAADISRFNRGPITSTFTAPASCVETPTSGIQDGTMYFGHWGTSYYDTACLPSSTAATKWDLYYYSPALYCPKAYTVATTYRSIDPGYGTAGSLVIGSDTSVYLCCPTGYAAQSHGHVCTSQFIGTTTLVYKAPSSDAAGNWLSTNAKTATQTWLSSNPLVIYGDSVQIWYESSDIITSPGSSTTVSQRTSPSDLVPSTSITSSTSVSTSDTTSTPTVTGKSSSSGLSTGAAAGIGVGATIVGLCAAAGLVYFFFRRRQHARDQPGAPAVELHDRVSSYHPQDIVHEL